MYPVVPVLDPVSVYTPEWYTMVGHVQKDLGCHNVHYSQRSSCKIYKGKSCNTLLFCVKKPRASDVTLYHRNCFEIKVEPTKHLKWGAAFGDGRNCLGE